jgi:acetolactate decarboxylase
MTRSGKRRWLAAVLLFILLPAAADNRRASDVLYQVSTINALVGGSLDGEVSFRQLSAHGDFGVGTFDALDGEMIELRHQFFQVSADGVVHKVNPAARTPFAMTTFFTPVINIDSAQAMDYKQLQAFLEDKLESRNIFYALKIKGRFKNIKVRSVHKQAPPYPGLNEAVKNQAVFEYADISGTLVGFYCPQLASGVNSPGFHFHFLSDDLKKGGHVLDLSAADLKIAIDPVENFFLTLPPIKDMPQAGIEPGKQ